MTCDARDADDLEGASALLLCPEVTNRDVSKAHRKRYPGDELVRPDHALVLAAEANRLDGLGPDLFVTQLSEKTGSLTLGRMI